MLTKYLAIFLVVVGIVSPLWSQSDGTSIEIRGTVTDATSQQPIGYATVAIITTKDSTLTVGGITDDTGQFNLTLVPQNDQEYRALVQFMGYQSFYSPPLQIDQQKAVLNLGTYSLQSDQVDLKEVVVTASAERLKTIPGGYALHVDEQLVATNANANDLLQILPGVLVSNRGKIELLGQTNVRILINGKPPRMNGIELRAYLRQLESNEILDIQVLTSPSAKYQAEGGGGLINILTKKKTQQGIYNRISTEIGTRDKYYVANYLSYTSQRLSAYLRASYRNERYEERNERFYENKQAPDSAYYFDYLEINRVPSENIGTQLGVDYSINDKNTLGGVIRFNQFNIKNNDWQTAVSTLNRSRELQSINYTNNQYDLTATQYFTDLNYRTEFGTNQQQLVIDVNGLYSERQRLIQQEDIRKDLIGMEPMLPYQRINRQADYIYRIGTATVDYTLPLNKWTLEAGSRYDIAQVDNDFLHEAYNFTDQQFIIDPGQTYGLLYRETTAAFYANLKGRSEKMAWEAGLRAENTDLQLTSESSIFFSETNRNNWYWFPSLLLKWYLSEKSSLSVNTGRRIDRPRYYTLNPYVLSPNPAEQTSGNPALKPTLVNHIKASYSLQWSDRHQTVISSGYSYNQDAYTYITEETEEDNAYRTYPVNLDHSTYSYFNLYSRHQLTNWFSLSANTFINRVTFDGSNFDIPTPDPVLSISGSLTMSADFWENTYVEVRGAYKSPQTAIYGRANGYQTVDFSAGKSFLDGSLQVGIDFTDIFNINENRFVYESPLFAQEGRWKYETRILTARISWKFGKKIKSKAKRYRVNQNNRFDEN